MSVKGSILVIDDETEIRESLAELLALEGYNTTTAKTGEEGMKSIENGLFDLVLLDINLPDRNGLDLLQQIKRESPDLGVIMITAYASTQMAFQASKQGADSYVTKPWDNDKLLLEVRNTVDKTRLQQENVQLRRALKRYDLPNVVGKSEKMHKVMDVITQVAASRATVLITGESGTGKELVAKTVHATSPRADRPFVPVNTGSMPVDLLESILFGHVKGAFTSASATKRGLFEVANQGTIFFDEIGTVGVETQAKLLRVIQEREFMRLGGTENIKVDVRILAATNADLRKMVMEGKFREDLFYRLNVITLTLPPLRDRSEDVPMLAEHFLKKFSSGKWPRCIAVHFRGPEGHDGLRLARQCSRAGKCRGTRRGALHRPVPGNRSSPRATFPGRRERDNWISDQRPRGTLIVRDHGELRTQNHPRHAGPHQLEPDGRRRAFQDPPLHTQSENQTPANRRQTPARVVGRRVGKVNRATLPDSRTSTAFPATGLDWRVPNPSDAHLRLRTPFDHCVNSRLTHRAAIAYTQSRR